MFLLDTSILVDLLNDQEDAITLIQTLPADELCISAITIAELEKGFIKLPSSKNMRRRAVLHDMLRVQEISIISVDAEVGYRYGEVQGELLKKGLPLGDFDGLIIATALVHNFEFVTRDEGFDRVPGLRLYSP